MLTCLGLDCSHYEELIFISFCATGEKDDAVDKSFTELDKYLSGVKPVSVPTYFVGARGPSAQRFLDALDSPENKADIHYLGKSGMQVIKGLSIAFLDTSADQVIIVSPVRVLAISSASKLCS